MTTTSEKEKEKEKTKGLIIPLELSKVLFSDCKANWDIIDE